MITLRRAFYSNSKKKSKKREDKSKTKAAASIAGGVGTIAAAKKLYRPLTIKSGEKLLKSRNNSDNAKEVKKALLEDAKKRGASVKELPGVGNSAYLGIPSAKWIKRGFNKALKKTPEFKRDYDRRKFDNWTREKLFKKEGFRGLGFDDLGEDRIALGKRSASLSDVDVIAHELGHREHCIKKGSGSFVGKASHRTVPSNISNLASHKASRGVFFLNGVHSGIKKEKNKKEGKKSNTWTKVKSVAIPAAAVAPGLIAEAAASRNGYKAMKRLGANKEVLKNSRKRMAAAFGTYVPTATLPLASGAGGELVGRGVGKLMYKDKTEKRAKKDDNTKK